MTKIYICCAVALLCAMTANAGTNNEINTVTSTGRQVSVTAVNPYIIKVSNHARESKSNESAAVNIHIPLITAQTTTAGRTRVLATSGEMCIRDSLWAKKIMFTVASTFVCLKPPRKM